MEYNFLSPNCGLKVSAICLGAMTFQKEPNNFMLSSTNIDKEASYKILDKFVELGGNFIDTANVYNEGQSEEIIGEWMKERGNRRDMVIATKVRFGGTGTPGEKLDPNRGGLSRKAIMDNVEKSLKRLQTDYIDLYQIHASDFGTPHAEVVRTMDELVRAGKVRYVGACNLMGWQMQKIVDTAKELGASPWVSLQSHYSIFGRDCEPEAFTVCKNEGLGVLPWGALKGGLLTGKFKRDDKEAPAGSRMEFSNKIKPPWDFSLPDLDKIKKDDAFWEVMDVIKRIADKHGKTQAQVSIRWCLQRSPVTSVIVGVKSVKQLEDNCGAVGWKLTDEEVEEISKMTTPKWLYPFSMFHLLLSDGREKIPAFV